MMIVVDGDDGDELCGEAWERARVSGIDGDWTARSKGRIACLSL